MSSSTRANTRPGSDRRKPHTAVAEQMVRPPLDVREAALYVNITERMVRSLVFQRRIPFTKIGRLVRFRPDDLDAWLELAVAWLAEDEGRDAAAGAVAELADATVWVDRVGLIVEFPRQG